MDLTTTIRRCGCGKDIGGERYSGSTLCLACSRKAQRPRSLLTITAEAVSRALNSTGRDWRIIRSRHVGQNKYLITANPGYCKNHGPDEGPNDGHGSLE